MFRQWLDRWKSRIKDEVQQFLFHADTCIYCKGAIKKSVGGERLLGLCHKCYQQIPWIKDVRCPICGRYEDCYDCRRRENTAFQRNRSAVRYDAVMKEWLSRWKYRGDERLMALFSGMLMHAYHKHLEAISEDGHGHGCGHGRGHGHGHGHSYFDYVVFVPLSQERLLERGFNQAQQLAVAMSRHIHVPVVDLLVRVRHTNKQSFKGRAERLEDLGGVFAIDSTALQTLSDHQIHLNRPLRLLVIDDVYTTGSTLQQCALIIREHVESHVFGLTWAR